MGENLKKECIETGDEFLISDLEIKFLDRISPVINRKKITLPLPRISPLQRLKKRLANANQIHLYTRTSSLSGKRIFSMYPSNTPFPVFENEEWYGDGWNDLDYAIDFDFSKNFFPQIKKLSNKVPHYSRMGTRNENCDYANNLSDNKNCYLCFNTRRSEDCVNCENIVACRDCLDCTQCGDSELCYESVACSRCYEVKSSLECEDCSMSSFLMNCKSCNNCFACVNLRHKEYCIFNKQYSKEEYFDFLAKINFHSKEDYTSWRDKAESFFLENPRPH